MMDESDSKNKLTNNIDFEKNSISEGFNSINKLQHQSTSMYKVNLAAALHDHISCTKLVQPNLTNHDGLITLSLPKDEENEMNLIGSCVGSNNQDDTFKDIILIQLDLVQYQQEQLLKKERQLQQARQDSESLYKRLESMEKEISNLKEQLLRKEENRLHNKRRSDHYLEVNKDDCLESQLTFTNFLSELSSTTTDLQQSTIHSNNETDQQLNVISGSKKVEDKKRKKSTSTKADNIETNKDDKKASTSKKKKVKDKLANEIKQSTEQEDEPQQKQIYHLPIKAIETDNEYEIVTNKDFFNSLDDELDLNQTDSTQIKSNQQSNIEIPSFRLNPISTTYSLEGTENLNDDVFFRRHSKLELDEKRRKRWDAQRLRQDNYNERLRSRYSSNSKTIVNNNLNSSSILNSPQIANNDNNSNDISSFYPSPNILKYIEISDTLPIVAFGQVIPELPVTNFSLPWSKTSNKLIKVTNKKN